MHPHPKSNTTTYRPFLERLGGSPSNKFVGEFGELFYDPTDPTIDSLRISDGKTPGGVKLNENIRNSISDIYNMIDGSRLQAIQEVINSFLEASIESFDDLKDRVLELEDTNNLLNTRIVEVNEELTEKVVEVQDEVVKFDNKKLPTNLTELPSL